MWSLIKRVATTALRLIRAAITKIRPFRVAVEDGAKTFAPAIDVLPAGMRQFVSGTLAVLAAIELALTTFLQTVDIAPPATAH